MTLRCIGLQYGVLDTARRISHLPQRHTSMLGFEGSERPDQGIFWATTLLGSILIEKLDTCTVLS